MLRLKYRLPHLCMLGLGLLAASSMSFAATVQVNVSGVTFTPSTAPGNETQNSEQNNSGVVQGNALSGSLARTRSGSTSDGRLGTESYLASASAALGVLHAISSVDASSTASPTAGWVSGGAGASASASFSDSARFYDPAYAIGIQLPMTIQLHMDWAGSYTGNFFGSAQAQASFGLAYGGGSISTYSLVRSDVAVPTFQNDASLRVSVINGDTLYFGGDLYTTASASFYGGSVMPGQTVHESAVSNAANTAHFYIYGDSASATVIGSDGHNYSLMAAVPEPQTWAMLLAGLGLLCQVSWAKGGVRRSRRTA